MGVGSVSAVELVRPMGIARRRSGRDPTSPADRVSSGFWVIAETVSQGTIAPPDTPQPGQDAALDPASLRANCGSEFWAIG